MRHTPAVPPAATFRSASELVRNRESIREFEVSVAERVLRPFAPPLSYDAEFKRQLDLVRRASALASPGSDARTLLTEPVTHPLILEWLEVGEQRLADIKGRKDLVRRRRHYILRDDESNPLDAPLGAAAPELLASRERRIYRLRDEAEWLAIDFDKIVHPVTDVRPVRAIFRHSHVRAILDWKASHLDFWLSSCPELLGGHIVHEFDDGARAALDEQFARIGRQASRPRRAVAEVKFDSWRFWLAYVARTN